MTIFRLEPASGQPFDLVLASARCTLWRRGNEVLLAVADEDAARVRRELAFHGVRARPGPAGPPVPPSLVRAVGVGLAPVRVRDEELDLIDVQPITLAEATARALRRPFRAWPIGARRRSRCRALLRGTDAVFEVRRTAWCTRATLGTARGSLRPALFDRSARSTPLRLLASEGRLSRWIQP